MIAIILKTIIYGVDVPGYASTMVVILFIGGIQLIFLGIIGEYLSRMYIQGKNRPVYIVKSIYHNKQETPND